MPVCVISTEESREDALELGAYSFVAKPIRSRDQVEQALDALITFATAPKKELLIASTSPKLREAWREALNGEDVVVADGEHAGERAQAAAGIGLCLHRPRWFDAARARRDRAGAVEPSADASICPWSSMKDAARRLPITGRASPTG